VAVADAAGLLPNPGDDAATRVANAIDKAGRCRLTHYQNPCWKRLKREHHKVI
jgi:hypothetical protein